MLIEHASRLYDTEDFGVDLKEMAYALDSTTIDLCLSLFPWARCRQRHAAIKLHTLLSLRGNFPTEVIVTSGRVHDVNILDQLQFAPGTFYIADRGYTDFARLHRIHRSWGFFVTRAKKNLQYRRRYSHPIRTRDGVHFDQTVTLIGFYSHHGYPDTLRRIGFIYSTSGKRLIFLTNNFSVPASIIAHLYKCRWNVQLFFKWIKQHFRIKAFYGTSENAVKTQIWIAIAVYVLVTIIRKELRLPFSLYSILQILSVTLFEKMLLYEAFSHPNTMVNDPSIMHQMPLQGL